MKLNRKTETGTKQINLNRFRLIRVLITNEQSKAFVDDKPITIGYHDGTRTTVSQRRGSLNDKTIINFKLNNNIFSK